jgi:DMSO reductase family type II enzyme chaperone
MEPLLATNPQPEIFDWDHIDLYRFFAFAFGPPSRERHEWFSQSGASKALGGLWRQLCGKKFPGFRWFKDYSSYEAAFIAAFDVGAPEAPVPLFESAHNKTRPAQELVLENTFFYDVFGLRVDPALSVPDHLLTQLEFLSALAFAREHSDDESRKRELAQLERDFLQRHLLSWTDKAEQKIRKCPFSAYRVLFSMLLLGLRQRYMLLAVFLRCS